MKLSVLLLCGIGMITACQNTTKTTDIQSKTDNTSTSSFTDSTKQQTVKTRTIPPLSVPTILLKKPNELSEIINPYLEKNKTDSSFAMIDIQQGKPTEYYYFEKALLHQTEKNPVVVFSMNYGLSAGNGRYKMFVFKPDGEKAVLSHMIDCGPVTDASFVDFNNDGITEFINEAGGTWQGILFQYYAVMSMKDGYEKNLLKIQTEYPIDLEIALNTQMSEKNIMDTLECSSVFQVKSLPNHEKYVSQQMHTVIHQGGATEDEIIKKAKVIDSEKKYYIKF